jgi:hypothetical protein
VLPEHLVLAEVPNHPDDRFYELPAIEALQGPRSGNRQIIVSGQHMLGNLD